MVRRGGGGRGGLALVAQVCSLLAAQRVVPFYVRTHLVVVQAEDRQRAVVVR